jgi:hypothetical protein
MDTPKPENKIVMLETEWLKQCKLLGAYVCLYSENQ